MSEYSHIGQDVAEKLGEVDEGLEIGREHGVTVFDEIMDRLFTTEQNFNKSMMEVKASHCGHIDDVKRALFT